MEIMLEKKIGSLPVLENGMLRGIITESDFLRACESELTIVRNESFSALSEVSKV